MRWLMWKWHDYIWKSQLEVLCRIEEAPLEEQPNTHHMSEAMERHWYMAQCYEVANKQRANRRRKLWQRKRKQQN